MGLPPWDKKLLTFAKSPLQPALQVARGQRGFTLCLTDWILIALAYNRGFKTTPWIGNRLQWEHLRNKKGMMCRAD
jgi:hypothetical protein